MDKVLLVNFEKVQAARLAAFLRIERHEVHIAEPVESTRQTLRGVATFDLVIVDASHREQYVRDITASIGAYRARNGPRPAVLCVCRSYRGPRFELDLEKKGARVIYV